MLKEWDKVRTVNGRVGIVKAVAAPWATVVFDGDEEQVHLDDLIGESEGPIGELIAGRLGDAQAYALRLQALFLRHAYRFDPRSGLSNARIEPNLHQIYVAHAVANKLQPRMVLADEVGLGKTIEAGLILKELRARGVLERVLVVAPASLLFQWQTELQTKFNEHFEIFDAAAAKYFGKGGKNPFEQKDNIICSLPFASSPKRAEQIAEASWDLVIFDEAHRVRRWRQGASKVNVTQAYRLADELKDLTQGFLMLTATPMQLHPYELYSLIELVEPGLYPSFEAYDRRRKDLPRLNALMRVLKHWNTLHESERDDALGQNADLLQAVLGEAARTRASLDENAARTDVMDALVARHPLAGALVRNRKAEIGGFMPREAKRFVVSLNPEAELLYEDVSEYIRLGYDRAIANKQHAIGFLMVTYQRMLASSTYCVRESFKKRAAKLKRQLKDAAVSKAIASGAIEELRDSAEEIAIAIADLEQSSEMIDPAGLEAEIAELEFLIERIGNLEDDKASALLTALDELFEKHPDEKVVIFTQWLATQDYLRQQLERDYSVAVFNGSMSAEDKESAIRLFRDKAQVLISTESGGEGRNLQFAHILVNYDLPWNPMKVEQRIGRLDRIGQKRKITIYNLACEGTVEERVLDVLEHRIQLFTESVGSLDPILGEVEQDIERLVMLDAAAVDAAFDELGNDVDKRTREARENERVLADFVLDRASLRQDRANELLGLDPLASHKDLAQFMSDALAYFGGTLKPHAEGGLALTFAPRLASRLRTVDRGGVRGVFDPGDALANEDLDFLAFGHPAIDAIVDVALGADPVVCAARRSAELPGPGPFVEVFYELSSDESLPVGQVRRHLVGAAGVVLTERIFGPPPLGEAAHHVEAPAWLNDALEASQRLYATELEAARQEIQAQVEQRRKDLIDRAHRVFGYRQERLRRRIDDDRAWIADKERQGTERDQKILPARRGKVAKDVERLEALSFELDEELSKINSKLPALVGRVWGAGLVVAR